MKKKTGSVKAAGDDRAPGLRKFEKVEDARALGASGGAVGRDGFGLCGVAEEHFFFGGGNARVIFGRVIEVAPHDEPEEPEDAGDGEGRLHAPTQI